MCLISADLKTLHWITSFRPFFLHYMTLPRKTGNNKKRHHKKRFYFRRDNLDCVRYPTAYQTEVTVSQFHFDIVIRICENCEITHSFFNLLPALAVKHRCWCGSLRCHLQLHSSIKASFTFHHIKKKKRLCWDSFRQCDIFMTQTKSIIVFNFAKAWLYSLPSACRV